MDRDRAAQLLAHALRPAPPVTIAQELYRLRTLTAGREGKTETDVELEASIWIEELSRYPADIVVATLREWPRRSRGQWWPTWAELARILDARASYRRCIAAQLGMPIASVAAAEDAPAMSFDEARREAETGASDDRLSAALAGLAAAIERRQPQGELL